RAADCPARTHPVAVGTHHDCLGGVLRRRALPPRVPARRPFLVRTGRHASLGAAWDFPRFVAAHAGGDDVASQLASCIGNGPRDQAARLCQTPAARLLSGVQRGVDALWPGGLRSGCWTPLANAALGLAGTPCLGDWLLDSAHRW